MLTSQLFLNSEGYLLKPNGSLGTQIVLSEELKNALSGKNRIEITLIKGVFKPF